MIFALLLSVLFLVGAIVNLTDGVYDEATAGVLLSALFAGLYFFNRRQEREIRRFLAWLAENKDELKSDPNASLIWEDSPVMQESFVTQYQFCASFVIVTFRLRTGYILDQSFFKPIANITATFLTLVLGWWGIPWGPIYSIQALFRNLTGGVKTSIHDLIVELESAQSGQEPVQTPGRELAPEPAGEKN